MVIQDNNMLGMAPGLSYVDRKLGIWSRFPCGYFQALS